MRLYRKAPGGPLYADTRHPQTGKRWQFATGETDLSAATTKADERLERLRAAMKSSGAGAPGTNPNGSRQDGPPPEVALPQNRGTGAPATAGALNTPPPASVVMPAGAGGGGRLAAALATMRAPMPAGPEPTAAPSAAKLKLAKWVGRKGTPVVCGIGEELCRRGFFVLEKREPAPLDEDEEEGISEAFSEYLATILPDTEVDPFGKLMIVFFLAFGGAWLAGTPIPPEKSQQQPAVPAREVA